MTFTEAIVLILLIAVAFAAGHIFLHTSISTKIDAAIDRVVSLMYMHHGSAMAKIAAIPVSVPVVAADVPSVSWSAQPVAVPASQRSVTNEEAAATSRNPLLLAGLLNLGGPEVIRLALINLLSTDSTADHRLGLLFDSTSTMTFNRWFLTELTPAIRSVIVTRLEAIAGTEQLRARLGCNPTLRYDGNGNYSTVTP